MIPNPFESDATASPKGNLDDLLDRLPINSMGGLTHAQIVVGIIIYDFASPTRPPERLRLHFHAEYGNILSIDAQPIDRSLW